MASMSCAYSSAPRTVEIPPLRLPPSLTCRSCLPYTTKKKREKRLKNFLSFHTIPQRIHAFLFTSEIRVAKTDTACFWRFGSCGLSGKPPYLSLAPLLISKLGECPILSVAGASAPGTGFYITHRLFCGACFYTHRYIHFLGKPLVSEKEGKFCISSQQMQEAVISLLHPVDLFWKRETTDLARSRWVFLSLWLWHFPFWENNYYSLKLAVSLCLPLFAKLGPFSSMSFSARLLSFCQPFVSLSIHSPLPEHGKPACQFPLFCLLMLTASSLLNQSFPPPPFFFCSPHTYWNK